MRNIMPAVGSARPTTQQQRQQQQQQEQQDSYYEVPESPAANNRRDARDSSMHAAEKFSQSTPNATDQYYYVDGSPDVQQYTSPPAKHVDSITYSTKFAKNGLASSGETKADSLQVVDLPSEIHPSPSVRRYESPPAKGTSSITFSTQFSKDPPSKDPNTALVDLARRRLDTTMNTHPSTASSSPDSWHESSPDPDGDHDRFASRDQSFDSQDDSYYDVHESPRASAAMPSYASSIGSSYETSVHVGDLDDKPQNNKKSFTLHRKPQSSNTNGSSSSSNIHSSPSLVYSSESGTSRMYTSSSGSNTMVTQSGRSNHLESVEETTTTISRGTMNTHMEESVQSSQSSAIHSSTTSTTHPSRSKSKSTSRSGSLHSLSTAPSYFTQLNDPDQDQASNLPITHKKTFAERNMLYRSRNQDALLPTDDESLLSSRLEPDGQLQSSDNRSTHGEMLYPTSDDEEFTLNNTSFQPQSFPSSSISASGALRSSSRKQQYSNASSRFTRGTLSSETSSQKPQNSPFPSVPCLVFLSILIFLALGGLVGGVTYYLWVKVPLDPLPPPTQSPVFAPVSTDSFQDDKPTDVVGVVVAPNDEDLLVLFERILGKAVYDPKTPAGMASIWILEQDPSKDSIERSEDAWIQRFLLVYTYYATTENGKSRWLSCNPPDPGESNSCQFSNPTELPGGKIIYDLVPSMRWLSGADECTWGGVACGKTLETPNGSTRLGVTSIVLADQYLRGSIVTELTQLPELRVLDLSHNDLEGTLSEDFRRLETLRLQYNALGGSIPSNFFDDHSVMKELNVGANSMSGRIPTSVGLASQITDLYLFDNAFEGTIPILGQMPLVHFQAQGNKFTGILPFDYSFGGKWPQTLTEWWAFDNALTGSLSQNLGFLSNLEDFRVQGNELTGSIPESISDLQRLVRMEVQSNQLTGTIPDGIGDLSRLQDFKLQFNAIEGVVPTSLCFLESMEILEADCLDRSSFSWNGVATAYTAPTTECYCCTTCCNAQTEECIMY